MSEFKLPKLTEAQIERIMNEARLERLKRILGGQQ